MGGFVFTKDGEQKKKITSMNLPMRNMWMTALRVSGEGGFLNLNVTCPADRDGYCRRKGCLNPNGMIAWEISLPAFIESNRRMISFIESYPQQLDVASRAFVSLMEEVRKAAGKPHKPVPKKRVKRFVVETRSATKDILVDLISNLRNAEKGGASSVFIWDRLSDPDCLPCPRLLPVGSNDGHQDIDGEQIKARQVDCEYLSYDDAVIKRESGEWKNKMDTFFYCHEEFAVTKNRY